MTVGLSDLYASISTLKETAKLSLKSIDPFTKMKDGRYTIIEQIGSGEFASVFKAIDNQSN